MKADPSLKFLLSHAGIAMGKDSLRLERDGFLSVNGKSVPLDVDVAPGDLVGVSDVEFRVVAGGAGRLQLVANETLPGRIPGKICVHAGYHKCLTEYSKSVYRNTCRSLTPFRKGSFRHYYHRDDFFYRDCHHHTISSISGHAIKLDQFEDIRVVRFIRDPRDLLVSGYFYHKRSAEHWCDLPDSVDTDWRIVGGVVPGAVPPGQSFSSYLNQASLEEGLRAEMEFRQLHFDSMVRWPSRDSRVKIFRYEDILGNEVDTFQEIFEFFELPWFARQRGKHYARKFSAAQQGGKAGHIRDARHGQWRRYFTETLTAEFSERHGKLLDQLGYPLT